MKHFELSPETAHPNAKKLMTEDFFWSPIEETGPFGSDDGSDAFYHFKDWREENKTTSPVVFIKELIENWGYSPFDLNELNADAIQNYISASSTGSMTLIGQDNAVIATGFGQFVLEGKIDEDIKTLTEIAVKRELLPELISQFRDDYRATRTEQLKKMQIVVSKMNSEE